MCGIERCDFGRPVEYAHNIKIKRNLKKKGIIGYQTVVHLMQCVQVQKMRTTLWHKFFVYLFAFFAGTFVLRIPSFLNFVNPFFVISNAGSSNKSKFRKHSQTNCNAGRALFAILRKKNRETTQLRIANRYVVSQFFLPNHTIPFPFKIM